VRFCEPNRSGSAGCEWQNENPDRNLLRMISRVAPPVLPRFADSVYLSAHKQ
jgi:hypothetical protein